MAINKVVYGNTALIDLTGDTVTSSDHIMQGHVGHLADGTQVTGTGCGGLDLPIFTVTWDDNYTTVRSVACNKTYQEIEALMNTYPGGSTAAVWHEVNTSGTESFDYGMDCRMANSAHNFAIIATLAGGGVPQVELLYATNGTITYSDSPISLKTLTVTQNGTYSDFNKAQPAVYKSVTVSVPIVTYYTGTSDPSSNLGNDGDIYLKVVS